MPNAPCLDRPGPEPRRSGHGAQVTVGAALVLCCAGHALLLTLGFAGVGAAWGALAGSTVLLALAAAVLTVTGGVIAARMRRRHRHTTSGRGHP